MCKSAQRFGARAEGLGAEQARAEQAQEQQAEAQQAQEQRPEAQEQQPQAEQAHAADDPHDEKGAKRMVRPGAVFVLGLGGAGRAVVVLQRTDELGFRDWGAPASGEAPGRYVGSYAGGAGRVARAERALQEAATGTPNFVHEAEAPLEQHLAPEPLEPVNEALRGELTNRPATAEALKKYVQSKESQRIRFEQRKLFLEGSSSDDVPQLEYTVHVTKGNESAAISLLGSRTSIPLREIEVLGKTQLGISAEEISRALCEMLGVSREEIDTTLKLEGFGKNGANVLIKPNVVASGKTLKNNRPDRQNRKFTLVRCAMCDLCGRVNLATAYTVKVEAAPAGWPCAKKLGLKVCGTKSCSGTADVLWVRGEFVRIDKDSHWHRATGTVMGGEAPMPPHLRKPQ